MPSSSPHIKALAFDAYGTLFDLRAAVMGFEGGLGAPVDDFAALWFRKKVEYSWLHSLMGREANFLAVTGEALDFALHAFGLDDPALRRDLLRCYDHLPVFPDALGALQQLKAADFPLAILSNGTPPMLQAVVANSELRDLIDVTLSAQQAGVFKPDPKVYQLAVDHFSLMPGQIGFVTANAWDAAGAAHFGLHVCWVNRNHAAPERLPAGPAIEVTSLEEVAVWLGEERNSNGSALWPGEAAGRRAC